MEHLRLTVQHAVTENRKRAREHISRGRLPNFVEGDYVLVAKEELLNGEKICLRWRGPRRIMKSLNDYLFDFGNLRNGNIPPVHGSRLKYHIDSSLNEKVILSHVLSS